MKLFGYLLTIYIILLSVVPCCSFDNCDEDQTEQPARHEQKDNDCGDCSPFFTCTGCSALAFTTDPLEIQLTLSNSQKIFTGYIATAVPDMNYDFWQPPKLA